MKFVLILSVLFVILMSSGKPAQSHDRLDADQIRAKAVICKVFGSYCGQALTVTWCESRYRVWAKNGQYLGLFQMGRSERKTYGHGPGSWAQARAAWKYFVATGKDWSPWECKPW